MKQREKWERAKTGVDQEGKDREREGTSRGQIEGQETKKCEVEKTRLGCQIMPHLGIWNSQILSPAISHLLVDVKSDSLNVI